jgi:hypothetical protein
MIKSIWLRITLAIIVAVAATAYLTQLDGQVFRNSLVFIGLMLASVLILVREAWRRDSSWLIRQCFASMALCLFIPVVVVAVRLPNSYRFQQMFNTKFQETFEFVGRKASERQNEP